MKGLVAFFSAPKRRGKRKAVSSSSAAREEDGDNENRPLLAPRLDKMPLRPASSSSSSWTSNRLRLFWHDMVQYRRTYMLTVVASFGGMLFGWDTGLIGGVLTMKSFQSSFRLHEDSPAYANLTGNIVSVLQAGCFFGAMSSFYVADRWGRKAALIGADVVFIVGSIIQACAGLYSTSLVELYVGRVIGGVGVGLISAVVPTYIGENANREIRGRCIGCMQLFNVTGIMISYFVNYGIVQTYPNTTDKQWRIPFALQILPGALLLAGIVFQNESPRWLVEKNKIEDARNALSIVRSLPTTHPDVERELDDIIDDFHSHERLPLGAQLRATLADSTTLYVFTMAITLMFFQQATGTNSINYYSPQIFKSIGLTGTSAGLFATGIYGVVKVVVTALGLMFATEQLGRKWSLILGGLGQAFAMYYIGINQALHPSPTPPPTTTITTTTTTTTKNIPANNIFAILCVYLFVTFYSFGWGPIPFVLSAECAPNHVRSLIMAGALMTQWLFNFVIAKLTPLMLADITHGTFLLFGTCCIFMVAWTVCCVPETKGVPLERIHVLFEGRRVRGAVRDTIPRWSRAKALQDAGGGGGGGRDDDAANGHQVEHVKHSSAFDEDATRGDGARPNRAN